MTIERYISTRMSWALVDLGKQDFQINRLASQYGVTKEYIANLIHLTLTSRKRDDTLSE
ncbi:hypothetical protein QNI19_11075 [Cytophagaceae bacterium DM2B3-1]|uniref:Mor transcription activator domain-containing protein n=1 Tax=Xanthocytophaga flava TaxID=3048013 RepID=A0AAE3U8M1_9BACT|nr:hypothetical protein [Xanthocytophaga flavus]MDJ1480829.1 hypothetical protein [Xanthocytophaga flavus]MDJ1493475.1 hypothetical protein [Xanthocytophaga flavus]